MSTLAYGALTRLRENAAPGTSSSTQPPGLRSWVDVLTALIPVEVLAAQAVVVALATRTSRDVSGNVVTVITAPGTIRWAFAGLALASIALYAVGHVGTAIRDWNGADWLRMLIPPLALLMWTMLVRTSAFDALFPGTDDQLRYAAAAVSAAVLAVVVATLSYRAAQSPARHA